MDARGGALALGTAPTSFCFGDGSLVPCPCGNAGAPLHGCANGTHASGARLREAGVPSISLDDFALVAEGSVPVQPGLFFQGEHRINAGAGVPFGDGLRCAGGNVLRLEVVVPDAAGSASSSVRISTAAGLSPGDIRYYQWWYRDPANSPCGAKFNLSNGLEVQWIS